MNQLLRGRVAATQIIISGVLRMQLQRVPRLPSPRLFAVLAKEVPPFVDVVETRAEKSSVPVEEKTPEKVVVESCGDVSEEDDDDEMEQEEMFVDPHESFEHRGREWGGPRRGGRLPEPTRFGDWERKGRCTDF